jgi:hypothetical protein
VDVKPKSRPVIDPPTIYPFVRAYAADGGPTDGTPAGSRYRRLGPRDNETTGRHFPPPFRPRLHIDPARALRLVEASCRGMKRFIRERPDDAAGLIDLQYAALAELVNSCDWRDEPNG